jgi:glycosyltransferase involved in cell wall biosynthesis
LIVAGTGPELTRLRARGGQYTIFIDNFTDDDADQLFSSCRAFLFPGEEDFGITMVEAQRFGKPVIAYAKGGSLDIVEVNKTGVLFNEQTVDSTTQAILACEQINFDAAYISKHAHQFDVDKFKENVSHHINLSMNEE